MRRIFHLLSIIYDTGARGVTRGGSADQLIRKAGSESRAQEPSQENIDIRSKPVANFGIGAAKLTHEYFEWAMWLGKQF